MDDPKTDEKRRDEVLKRMLATPPKPHDGKSKVVKEAPAKPERLAPKK
ncbi:MAG: hypothetical protein Q8S58_20405 [Bosea sp. (in: a-proteobacteria)]|nr:hypothetical protein [Bosea sp. (in: a-proteobacteria)]MDP3257326.1 hypothetical protein [Bosea sp. (in: a-proteobacteria)]MDP3321492.1 hypothetical protein [Bosea sp. (in: a-proteobacteria)]